MTYSEKHLNEVRQIIESIDVEAIESMVKLLSQVRTDGGRLFFLGVGGSAGNCSHAVNDFRKIAGFESYAPTDNVSELTARTNDEGWDTVFVEWLKTSRLSERDAVFVFSVGGGDLEKMSAQIWSGRCNTLRQWERELLGLSGGMAGSLRPWLMFV